MKISIVDNQNMKLFQGDVNQYLKIEDCPDGKQVQFFDSKSSHTMGVEIQDDGLCPIPNQYFDGSYEGVIKFYIYSTDKTIAEGAFEIKPRQLPSDYMYEPTTVQTYEAIIQEMKDLLADCTEQSEAADASATNAATSEANAKASEDNVKTIETNVSSMKASVEKCKSELEGVIEQAKTDITSKKEDAIDTITSKETDATDTIASAQKDATAAIATDKANAISAIEEAETATLKAIQTQETSSIEGIQKQEADSKAILEAYEEQCKTYADKAEESAERVDLGTFYTKDEVDTKFTESETKLQNNTTITVDSENNRKYNLSLYGSLVASFEVPVDKFIKSVTYDEDTRKLVFVFYKADETEETVYVDISSLVDVYTAGMGLAVSNNQFSLKIKEGETHLKVDASGAYTDISDKSDVGHTHTKSEITDFEHNHDDRYYTESEIDSKISALGSVDTALEGKIENEATLRETADTSLETSLTSHLENVSNPHRVTKEQLGLENVDNTSDLAKPISTATQEALDTKLDTPTSSSAPLSADKIVAVDSEGSSKFITYQNMIDDLALYNTEDKTWKTILDLISSGKFSSVYPVGSTFYVPFTYNGTTYQYPFQVADGPREIITPDGSVQERIPLLGLYLCPQTVQFSQYRAFLACPQGLSAGTYSVTFAQAWSKLTSDMLTWSFTITKAVPAGGRIAGFRSFADGQSDTNIRVYDAEGKNILETVTCSQGEADGATSLGTMALAKRNGNLSSMQETFYGCNEYHTSAKRQWMDSTKLKNAWWSAQDEWDCAPDALATYDGLLSCFDSEFVSILKAFQIKTAKSTALGAGTNDYDIDYVKCCLPSLEEMYIVSQAPAGIEGAYFPLCKEYVGKDSPNGWYSGSANTGLIRYDLIAKSAQWWHTRSANRDNSYYVWRVYTAGFVDNNNARNTSRVLPLVYI